MIVLDSTVLQRLGPENSVRCSAMSSGTSYPTTFST